MRHDLSFVWQVAEEIAENIKKYCLVVTKSTVPVGTTREVKKIISNKIDQKLFDIVSNLRISSRRICNQ